MTNPSSQTEKVTVRRSPKYLTFIITGAVIGVIVAGVIGLTIPEQQRTAEPVVTYLIAYIGGIGVVLGIVVALIVDRIGLAKAKTVEATKLKQ